MLEYTQNQTARVHVLLTDTAGAPVAGVINPTVTVEKSTGTTVSTTPVSWTEVTTGAFAGQGKYDLVLPSVVTDVKGPLVVAVSGGTGKFLALIHIVAATADDVYTRLGAPTNGSVSQDVAAVNTRAQDLQSRMTGMETAISRVRGLLNENAVQDQQSYDGNGRLTGARIRCFDTAANAQAATGVGLLRQYTVTAAYDVGGNLNLFRIVEG